MATKIKLKRLGKMRAPYYRIVVADARTKRDGRAIEEIGKYHPKEDPSVMEVSSERAQYWLSVGAQPTDPVRAIFSKTGDWQRFKGLPAPPPLLMRAPRPDKRAAFEAAHHAGRGEETGGSATTPKSRGGRGGTRDDHAGAAPEQPGVATGASIEAAGPAPAASPAAGEATPTAGE